MFLSFLQTSIYSQDSSENLNNEQPKSDQNLRNRNLSYTSTTPLEPDKHILCKSVENLSVTKEKENPQKDSPTSEVEDEFDIFTKERVEKNGQPGAVIKKTTVVPLEPKVLILNAKNNLGTVEEDEEKAEDIHAMISDAASSITQFCQSKYQRDLVLKEEESKAIGVGEKNPFSEGKKVLEREDSDVDPLLKVNLEITEPTDSVTKTENTAKETDKAKTPWNFEEISRKPEMFKKVGLENSPTMVRNTMPENKPFLRDRSASIGTLNLKTPIAQLIGEQNRTMLFQVRKFLPYCLLAYF